MSTATPLGTPTGLITRNIVEARLTRTARPPSNMAVRHGENPPPIAKLTPGNKSIRSLAAHRAVVHLLEAVPPPGPAVAGQTALQIVISRKLAVAGQTALQIVIPRKLAVAVRTPLEAVAATTVPVLAQRAIVVLPAWQAAVEVLAPQEAVAAGKEVLRRRKGQRRRPCEVNTCEGKAFAATSDRRRGVLLFDTACRGTGADTGQAGNDDCWRRDL